MSQMAGSYSTDLLDRASNKPDTSWFSQFRSSLRNVLLEAPVDPGSIGRMVAPAFEPIDRRGKISDSARTPVKDPFEAKITPDQARLRSMAGRIITGGIERGSVGVSDVPGASGSLADKILLQTYEKAIADPMADEGIKAQAAEYLADHERRVAQRRLEGEASLAQTSAMPSDLPERYVELWSQGKSDQEISGLIGDTWQNLDDENAQRMMDRLEIEADILQDQGKLLEAQGLLRARRAIMQKSTINVDANARPYDVLLDQMVKYEASTGGARGAFQAAGADSFVSTVRGIGRLVGVYPQHKDYMEHLTAASYEEHPIGSFSGSMAGGIFDPIFFALSMGIAKAPITAASRLRYTDDLVRTGVPQKVAERAAAELTLEGLATHRLARYFLNSEKLARAVNPLVRSRGIPLTEDAARSLAGLVWNATDGAVSNAIAEGIAAAGEGNSPLEVTARMFQGGAMGLGMGVFLDRAFATGRGITRLVGRDLPPDVTRALDAGTAYVASGAEDAPQVRAAVEQAMGILGDAVQRKGDKLTDREAFEALAEWGIDISAMHDLRKQRAINRAVQDGVVDAGELDQDFKITPETVEAQIDEAIPDATSSMAASLTEEATAHRAALAELEIARTEAETDPLTELLNRRGMERQADEMFRQADKAHQPTAIVAFDLSNFKALNDVMGHEAGDEALKIIGRVVMEEARGNRNLDDGGALDFPFIASRPGGDEFSVILGDVDERRAKIPVERIEARVAEELEKAGLGGIETTRGRRNVRLVGGIAVRGPGSGAKLAELLNAADQASIARKAALKADLGEPEGRFDISEVEGVEQGSRVRRGDAEAQRADLREGEDYAGSPRADGEDATLEQDADVLDSERGGNLDEGRVPGDAGDQEPGADRGEAGDGDLEGAEAADAPGERLPGEARLDDVDPKLAYRAHAGTSHTPDARARQEQEGYLEEINEFRTFLEGKAKTDQQRARIPEELERYRLGYLKKLNAELSARSRMMSPMITGPANFPVARMEKISATHRKRVEELMAFRKKARAAALRNVMEADPAAMNQAATEGDVAGTRKTMERIIEAFKGKSSMSVDLAKSNLVGRLKTMAHNGDIESVEGSLAAIREMQKDLKRPVFTDRHSIWKLGDTARAARAELDADAGSGLRTIAEYEDGTEIIADPAIDRVQIHLPGKPSAELKAALKAEGWNWSPKNTAWQRKLTKNAEVSAQNIMRKDGQVVKTPELVEPSEADLPATVEPATEGVDEKPGPDRIKNLEKIDHKSRPVVDGLTVRDRIPNQDSISASLEDYTIHGVRVVPFSDFSGKPGPRTTRIQKLMDGIYESGEIEPLIVVYDNSGQGPYVLEGSHRWDALQHLGKKEFPAYVVEDLEPGKVDDGQPTQETPAQSAEETGEPATAGPVQPEPEDFSNTPWEDPGPEQQIRERLERRIERLDPEAEGDAKAILTAYEDARRQAGSNAPRMHRFLDPGAIEKVRSARYFWEGERLLPNIDKLNPRDSEEDAQAIVKAYEEFAQKRDKEGKLKRSSFIRDDLADVVNDKYAQALIRLKRDQELPTGMDDMRVWNVENGDRKNLEALIVKAQKIDKQYGGGTKLPPSERGEFRPYKPSGGGISVAQTVKTRLDLQKSILKRVPSDDMRAIKVEDGAVTFMHPYMFGRLVMEEIPGKFSVKPGYYEAQGRGLMAFKPGENRKGPLLDDLTLMDAKKPIVAPVRVDLREFARIVGKADLVRGESPEHAMAIMVNPDGTIGIAAHGDAGTVTINDQEGTQLVGVFASDRVKDMLDLLSSANTRGNMVEITFDDRKGYVAMLSKLDNGSRTILTGQNSEKYKPADVLAKAKEKGFTRPKKAKTGPKITQNPVQPPKKEGGNEGAIQRMSMNPEGIVDTNEANLPKFVREDAKTAGAKDLVRRIRSDSEGKKISPRSIRAWLNDEIGVMEIMRREQTTRKHPGHYEPGPRLIRQRYHSAGFISFHETGHAISALARDVDDKFITRNKDFLEELAARPSGYASSGSAEEGFAELVRLYIQEPHILKDFQPYQGVIDELELVRTEKGERVTDLMRDAARAWRAHMDRSLKARWRSHMNDSGREPIAAGGVLRNAMAKYGSRGYAVESVQNEILSLIRKDADTISDGWKKVAELEKSIKDTPGDMVGAYNSLLHIDQSVGIALEGTSAGGKGGGLRVYATEYPRSAGYADAKLRGGLDKPDVIESLREGGFKISDDLKKQLTEATHGDTIVLADRSIREIIEPVKDKWDDFEQYAQTKATAARALVRPFPFQTMDEGTKLGDLLVLVRDAEAANPEYLTTFEALQDVMDKTLILDVMSGELTVSAAVELRNKFESYLPLTRVNEQGIPRVRVGASTAPTSGIRKSRGSYNAAEPVLSAIHRKIAQSVNAYYWNRFLTSPIHFAQEISKQAGVSQSIVNEANRVMLRLRLDTKVAANLSTEEQKKNILRWIQAKAHRLMAAEAGVDLDRIDEAALNRYLEKHGMTRAELEEKLATKQEEDTEAAEAAWIFNFTPEESLNLTEEDIDIAGVGAVPIFRRVKPAAINLVAPKIGGETHYYQINDPLLYQVFASEEHDISKWITGVNRVVGSMTEPWKKSITQTLVFAARSLARDYPTAMAIGMQQGDYRALIPGFYHVLGAMHMVTGKTPDSFSRPEILSRTFRHVTAEDFVEQRSRLMRELAGDLVPAGWKDFPWYSKVASAPGIAVRVMLRPIEIMQTVSGQRAIATLAETAPRIGAYVAAKGRGLSDESAQFAADTITGYFAERPLSNNAHAIYRMAGFVNPATQITMQYAKLLADPVPARAATRIGLISASLATASSVIWAIKELLQNDEDLAFEQERTEQDRLTHMAIPIPGRKGMVRVPFDYGVAGGIQSFVYNTLDQEFGDLPKVERTAIAGRILRESLPPQVTNPLELLPPIGRAGIEAKTNYSFWRDRSIVPEYMTFMDPAEQAFTTTPEIYRFFGKLTGLSPVKIEHVVRNGISVKLADMVRTLDRAEEGLVLDELYQLPEIGRMFSKEPIGWDSRSVESVEDLDRTYKALKRRVDALDEQGADEETVNALRDDLDDYAPFHRAMLEISRIYDDAKEAETPEERRRFERMMVEEAQRALEDHLEAVD